MKNIITEEMRFRQKLCEYVRKNGFSNKNNSSR